MKKRRVDSKKSNQPIKSTCDLMDTKYGDPGGGPESDHHHHQHEGSKSGKLWAQSCSRNSAIGSTLSSRGPFLCSGIGLGLLLGSYMLLGALLFTHLEGPHEASIAAQVHAIRNDTVERLWNITDKFNVLYKGNLTRILTCAVN